MTIFAVLGIAAGILSMIDPVPYIRDILRGTTRPHRGTWLIWSVLGATAFASQLSDGLDASLLLYPAYFAIANGAIAVVIASRRRRIASAVAGAQVA